MSQGSRRIEEIIDTIISMEIRANSSPAELYKVRFLAAMALFFVLVSIVSVGSQLLMGAELSITMFVPILSIFTSATILTLLKICRSPRAAMMFFQCCFVTLLPLAIINNKTILSPPMFCLPVIPLLFTVLGDVKRGLSLFAISFVISVTGVLLQSENPYLDDAYYQTKAIAGIISVFAASMTIGGLAYISKRLSLLVEDDLQFQKDSRENSEQMKTRFLANISHEIRTPLNNVIGHSELLRDRLAVHDFSHFHLDNIFRSSRQLVEIINNIIEASRLDINTYSFEPRLCHVAKVIYEHCHPFAAQAQAKGLDFSVELSDKLRNHNVMIAEDALGKIIHHLTSNATKFTSEGQIRISAKFDFINKCLVLTVADSGVGISEEAMAGVYEKFIQGNEDMTREFGGLGLGLAIAKTIVDKAFGTITFDSSPGLGSTFTVTLPARIIEAKQRRTKNSCAVHVIDPTGLISEYLGAMTKTMPFSSCSYSSIHQFKGATIKPGDIVILQNSHSSSVLADIHTYVQERRLKVKVLVHGSELNLKGWQSESNFSFLNHLGDFAHHLPQATQPGLEAKASDSKEARKILIVDDAEDNRTLMRLYLESHGFQTATAADGKEAVEAVMAESFDLILMDIQMPRMDGFEATAMIKDWEQNQPGREHTPIVIVTAHDIDEHREQCHKLETAGFITKPLRKKNFVQEIDTVLVEIDRKRGAA